MRRILGSFTSTTCPPTLPHKRRTQGCSVILSSCTPPFSVAPAPQNPHPTRQPLPCTQPTPLLYPIASPTACHLKPPSGSRPSQTVSPPALKTHAHLLRYTHPSPLLHPIAAPMACCWKRHLGHAAPSRYALTQPCAARRSCCGLTQRAMAGRPSGRASRCRARKECPRRCTSRQASGLWAWRGGRRRRRGAG